MKKPSNRLFIFLGILIPIIFWSSTLIAGIVHENYNHFQNTISELGAIGAKSENLMTFSTWVCTFLSVLFLVGLFVACKELKLKIFPLIGILGFSIMFGWAATFHSGNPMHSKSGLTLLLLFAGPLLSIIFWKANNLRSIRRYSLVSIILMLFILLRVVAPESIKINYTGLIQRFVHLGWSIWFVGLSLNFLKLLKQNQTKAVGYHAV